jgi:putative inorganic carbon (hco3(-)) transporter
MSTPSVTVVRLPVPSTPAFLLTVSGAGLFGTAIAVGSPWLIAAALMGPLLAVVARPEGATLCFVLAAYINLPVLLSKATGIYLLNSASVLLLLVPLAAYVLVRRDVLVITPALGLLVAYLAALVISALAAGASETSAQTVTNFATEGLLLYVLVTNAIRTTGMVRAVLWALLAAGAIMGAVSVFQELTHTYRTTLGGLGQVNRLDAGVAGIDDARPRLAGPVGEKNRYAQVLLVLLPFAAWAARYEARRALRLAAIVSGALALGGIVLTFSRGGFVALVVLVVAMVAAGLVRLRHVLAVTLAFAALVMIAMPDYVARLQTLSQADAAASQDGGADGALRGRATENLAALHAFGDHPVLGVGPGEFFARESTQYANALDLRFLDTRRRAHSLYLEMAADTGLLGLLLFLAIVTTTMVALWRLARFWEARWRYDHSALARALVLALVAYLTSGLFLQLAYQRYFWLLVAVANAAIWAMTREGDEMVASQAGNSNGENP